VNVVAVGGVLKRRLKTVVLAFAAGPKLEAFAQPYWAAKALLTQADKIHQRTHVKKSHPCECGKS
jgi:hypothetical protein